MTFHIDVPVFYVANLVAKSGGEAAVGEGVTSNGAILSGVTSVSVRQVDPNKLIPYELIYKSLVEWLKQEFKGSIAGISKNIDVTCTLHRFEILPPRKNFDYFPGNSSSPIGQSVHAPD